jgi:triacylglycerol lipase
MTRFRSIVLTLAVLVGSVVGITAVPAGPAQAVPTRPVIFVHGFVENSGIWATARQSFQQSGYPAGLLFAWDYDTVLTNNETTSRNFGAYLDSVLRQTGAQQVDIVSHSMGSLSTRHCIKFGSCAGKVRNWVSLAGANKGTDVAGLCFFLAPCQDMIPGSPFLQRLNAAPLLPVGVEWSTFWTPNDGIIVPATNTVLEGAVNTQVNPALNHLNIFSDATVLDQVKAQLAD